MNSIDSVKAGIFGLVVGDALGVPVEFTSRTALKENPVRDMREYGTHNQPKGTWSDDGSMALATMDSIVFRGGIQYDDIMMGFRDWRYNAAYTPYKEVFDYGNTCAVAIARSASGIEPTECGAIGEGDNGNGSLMRIMPVSLYEGLEYHYWQKDLLEEAVDAVHGVSQLTHGHPRSLMACVLYTSICHELIYREKESIEDAMQRAIDKTFAYYETAEGAHKWKTPSFEKELRANTYARIRNLATFRRLPEEEIMSSGYVVHTLEAAIWCLLNTGSYAECVLKAVNLGEDTDTVGAVAGGLAGLAYGFEAIPKEWLDVIAMKDWIEKLCNDFDTI